MIRLNVHKNYYLSTITEYKLYNFKSRAILLERMALTVCVYEKTVYTVWFWKLIFLRVKHRLNLTLRHLILAYLAYMPERLCNHEFDVVRVVVIDIIIVGVVSIGLMLDTSSFDPFQLAMWWCSKMVRSY